MVAPSPSQPHHRPRLGSSTSSLYFFFPRREPPLILPSKLHHRLRRSFFSPLRSLQHPRPRPACYRLHTLTISTASAVLLLYPHRAGPVATSIAERALAVAEAWKAKIDTEEKSGEHGHVDSAMFLQFIFGFAEEWEGDCCLWMHSSFCLPLTSPAERLTSRTTYNPGQRYSNPIQGSRPIRSGLASINENRREIRLLYFGKLEGNKIIYMVRYQGKSFAHIYLRK